MFTEEKLKEVKLCIIESVKNMNRILQKWVNESNVKGSHIKISTTEIRGLCRGEIKRALRNHMDIRDLDMIFKSTAIFIDADMTAGYIRSLDLGTVDTWRQCAKTSEQIKAMLKSINYMDLIYNSSDYSMVGDIEVPIDKNFNPLVTFDYGILNAIHF